jgi:hypothetical protein
MKIECPFCRSKISDEAVVCPNCGAEKTIKYVRRDSWDAKWAMIGALISILGFASMIQGIWSAYMLWKPSWSFEEYYGNVGAVLLLYVVFSAGVLLVMRSAPGEEVEIIVWHRNGVEKRAL